MDAIRSKALEGWVPKSTEMDVTPNPQLFRLKFRVVDLVPKYICYLVRTYVEVIFRTNRINFDGCAHPLPFFIYNRGLWVMDFYSALRCEYENGKKIKLCY
jgi:hypothetical protein